MAAENLEQRIERCWGVVVLLVEGGCGSLDTLGVGYNTSVFGRGGVGIGWLTLQQALKQLHKLLLVHD
jgi:hypothetical protein